MEGAICLQTSTGLDNRALAGALAKLAVPIVLQNLISSVVNAADVFMLRAWARTRSAPCRWPDRWRSC